MAGFVLFSGATSTVAEVCANKSPCAQPTAWNTAFDVMDIRAPAMRPGDYANWRIERSARTHDTKITVDQMVGGNRVRGELTMVGGRVLITKGLVLEEGYEIDAVDGPFIYALLTTQLLGRAFPEGPDSLNGTRRINVTERREGINIGTPSASAEFAAPWTVVGSATKEKSGAVRFDLKFKSAVPAGATPVNYEVHLTGSLSHAATDPAPDANMALQGWKVYRVGPRSQTQGAATVLDYGATPDNKGYATIADIRQAIAAEISPGTPDRNMDFTGFWKETCDEDFGLQIKPVGTDGIYSVSFCGPGGCFDADTYRPNTFITGDKCYEVVSQDSIKVRGSEGWSAYRKCSADPNATPDS